MVHDSFLIKPYTPQELATLYGVTPHALRIWLKPHLPVIGKRLGHLYTVRQVELIFSLLGWPPGALRAVA